MSHSDYMWHQGVDAFRAEMIAAIGSAPREIEHGRLHRFSTSSKLGDRSGWCRLFLDGRAGVFGCFRQAVCTTWTATPREQMTPLQRGELVRQIAACRVEREAAQRIAWRRNGARIRLIDRQCRPVVADDPVHRYLCRRLALESLTVPECIRLHPSMAYMHDSEEVGSWPAMVAPLFNRIGALVALHRTYLDLEGRKAAVPGAVKKLTPAAGLLSGASIPLYPTASGVLGVAEGIETALAAHCASGMPTVAAYSAGAMAGWAWPTGLRRLVIFADADPVGADAADRLRHRARTAGLSVEVITPTTAGSDWCDVWANRNAKEATA